ncbi:coiled-coil domain-containing protein [Halostella salina]|uniref:hypothetical protein n=1 Tax=Halostella salina TaxID=1547897 RepID=UPI000EF7AF5B|nr:hypothetical protein [Halostella salina]
MRVTDVCYEQGEGVEEERARAFAVNEVLRGPLSEFLESQEAQAKRAAAVGAIGIVLGGALLIGGSQGTLGAGLIVVGAVIGGGGLYYVRSQDPDVTVTGVRKGYWTSYCVPEGDGAVLYDATDSRQRTTFNLELLDDRDRIARAREQLQDVEEFPVVMPADENVEETVAETLESVSEELDSARERTVSAPVIGRTEPAADAVDFLADRAVADPIPTETAIDPGQARDDVSALADLKSMAATADGDAELEAVSESSRTIASDLSGHQETAIGVLNDHIETAADAFGIVSYHFYCPDCLTDDVETRLELVDPDDGTWVCETCRNHHETAETVPRHRIEDDIVNPVWDQLWTEKDDERRRIYEEIEDQKADLTEREFEQRQEEIRSATDRIRDLRSRVRDLETQAKAAEGTVDEIGELMVKYEHLHQERKAEFQTEVSEAFAEIDAKTEQILAETRNEEQERIEAAEQAAQEKAELMREEKQKRERAKFMARQQMENKRTKASMQNERATTAAKLSQSAKQHKQDVLLDTHGSLSSSKHINNARKWKVDNLGASKNGGGT